MSSAEPAPPTVPAPAKKPKHRWIRGTAAWALTVLGCLLALASVLVIFARAEVLDTDTYVNTVSPLAANPAIQHAVATQVSTTLVESTHLEAEVKQALPKKAGFLAEPVASAVQSAVYAITLRLVESEQFQKLWDTANRVTHTQVVNLLTGAKQGALSSSDGKITVDLSQIESKAKQALVAKGITVFNRIQTNKGPTLVLFQSDQLVKLQGVVKVLNDVTVPLPIVSILLLALAVILVPNRRRGLVRVALALALTMALLLIGASVGRNHYLNSLKPQPRGVAGAILDALSSIVLDTARSIFIVALLVALGAVLAGNAALRHALSRRQPPPFVTRGAGHEFLQAHRARAQWGVFGLGVLVLVVWNEPTAFVAVVTVLVTLAVVGVVGVLAGASPTTGAEPPADDSSSSVASEA